MGQIHSSAPLPRRRQEAARHLGNSLVLGGPGCASKPPRWAVAGGGRQSAPDGRGENAAASRGLAATAAAQKSNRVAVDCDRGGVERLEALLNQGEWSARPKGKPAGIPGRRTEPSTPDPPPVGVHQEFEQARPTAGMTVRCPVVRTCTIAKGWIRRRRRAWPAQKNRAQPLKVRHRGVGRGPWPERKVRSGCADRVHKSGTSAIRYPHSSRDPGCRARPSRAQELMTDSRDISITG